MFNYVIMLLIVTLLPRGNCKCEDGWFEYNNEKCYKIMGDYVTYSVAVEVCKDLPTVSDQPKLLEILSVTEQDFVSNLIFDVSEIFDSVWLGAKRLDLDASTFIWSDGSRIIYSNWENGIPSNNTANNCSQISSGLSKGDQVEDLSVHTWADVPCTKRNLVVCQTSSTLSLKQLQNILFEVRNNPVPMGFIYSELPFSQPPQRIWPNLVWKDVSAKYAGAFFSVIGGDSAEFEEAQSESAPRIVSASSTSSTSSSLFPSIVTLPVGANSEYLRSGYFTAPSQNAYEGIRFQTSADKVRPLNYAVRIWERVG